MQLQGDERTEVVNRLRRVEGQIAGIVRMLEEDRECAEVVTQLSAASRALHRAGFKVISSGLQQCWQAEDSEETAASRQQLEKLFLTLA